jgi:cystathionine beta-lyase family protein involved in aluminum resistance
MKVLKAFIDNGVSSAHLAGSSGYGYGDTGRDTLDRVFAQAVGAEDALVRHSFVSGTHALAVALFGLLRPNQTLVSLTGKPYDTLEEVIGLRGAGGEGSLADFSVNYRQVDMADGRVDTKAACEAVLGADVAYIQRSRGYGLRPALSVGEIGSLCAAVKAANPGLTVMVDNCYGEFVEGKEPTETGADLIVGSLIKNPGGGIARTGGYIAGKKALVERVHIALTTPGLGREVAARSTSCAACIWACFWRPPS